jgi:hypothetical protein
MIIVIIVFVLFILILFIFLNIHLFIPLIIQILAFLLDSSPLHYQIMTLFMMNLFISNFHLFIHCYQSLTHLLSQFYFHLLAFIIIHIVHHQLLYLMYCCFMIFYLFSIFSSPFYSTSLFAMILLCCYFISLLLSQFESFNIV